MVFSFICFDDLWMENHEYQFHATKINGLESDCNCTQVL
uniref:Uncharacterized protein n=1 Tax=Arundo donax TaxID=35708 RepID=A0A0A8YW61_ARUDO